MALLDDEAALRVNVFDWQAEFPQVFPLALRDGPRPGRGRGRG